MNRRRRAVVLLVAVVAVSLPVAINLASSQSTTVNPNEVCLGCHGNAGRIISLLKAREEPTEEEASGGCAVAPGRSAFLNYFVKADFMESFHGRLGCVACHGGDVTIEDVDAIHAEMKVAVDQCANCHNAIVDLHQTSIHWTLAGQDASLRMRAGTDANYDALEPVRRNDCNTCHASCGDCHVTIPQAVGGGLIAGHEFFGTPPMEDTCAVCHGSRAGAEFLGTLSEDLPADVHFQAGMTCLDCHDEPMHGDGTLYDSRWEVAGMPQCIDCHEYATDFQTPGHIEPHDTVSCQVCHAVAYKNCAGCHASIDEDGDYHRAPEVKEVIFKIGLNTVPGYPYEFVPVRSNPVARDAFAFFGENLLPNFDLYPTWKTAAPHNIQRITPQNSSCASCHSNETLFLVDADLDPGGSQANTAVTVEKAP